MLGKTLTYKDFNDQDVKDTFYFNLTEAELLELNIRDDLEAVGKSGNANKIMDTFKRILKASYGVRTPGGAKFIKTDQDWNEFVSSAAYSQIFIQLVTDAEYASAFIRELVPADLAARVEAKQEQTGQSASEIARANSEATLRSHLKPATAADASFQAPIPPHESYTSRREAMAQETPPQP
jgi:hypothetical protein